jgi:NSS family neurotransmitter:Na+ symporter
MSTGRSSWSGQAAFILAAAASAVGLGNLWRFPYLAARYGGGVFIAAYLILSLTLGATLLITEIAIGRASRQSQLTAFSALGHPKWNFVGILATIVPLFILPYYCAIGGWVVKYFAAFITGFQTSDTKAMFDTFVADPWQPFVCMAIFLVATLAVVTIGVRKGIEKANLIMMPALLITALIITIYVACLPGAGAGIKYYLVPDFSSCGSFGKVILGAMGQMFYSLSLAMGIMITYGSYIQSKTSIPKASVRIVSADTLVAILSGFMVIPVLIIFTAASGAGREAIDAGPGLMFVTLPKIFASLGLAGKAVGILFFTLVLFAALTSAISMTEACVASVCDFFRLKRHTSVAAIGIWTLVIGSISAFGYGRWASLRPFGMPPLEFFDTTMNVLTPIVAALTCVFVGWVLGPSKILSECHTGNGSKKFATFYTIMVKYAAPLLVLAIIISEVCRTFGLGGWSI